MQNLLTEFNYKGDDIKLLTVYKDNTSSLVLAKNPEHHYKAKHIDIRAYFICQYVENGSIKLSYIPTSQIVANSLTKPLTNVKHQSFI